MYALGLYWIRIFFGLFIGIVNHNPGVVPFTRVHVFWFAIYAVLLTYFRKASVFRFITYVILATILFICLYDIYFYLSHFGYLPKTTILDWYNDGRYNIQVGFLNGAPRINIYNSHLLLYYFPFTLGLLFHVKSNSSRNSLWGEMRYMKNYLIVLLLLQVIVIIITGRRVMYGAVVISIVAYYLSTIILIDKRTKRYVLRTYWNYFSVVLILAIFVIGRMDLNFEWIALYDNFAQAFEASTDNNRFIQANELITSFKTSPIMGHGLGDTLRSGYNRNPDSPWIFELTYLSDLNQFGLVGSFIQILFYGFIFISGYLQLKKKFDFFLLSILIGLLMFLIGNASNPYLSSFDFIWVLFLPMATINYLLLNKRDRGT